MGTNIRLNRTCCSMRLLMRLMLILGMMSGGEGLARWSLGAIGWIIPEYSHSFGSSK